MLHPYQFRLSCLETLTWKQIEFYMYNIIVENPDTTKIYG